MLVAQGSGPVVPSPTHADRALALAYLGGELDAESVKAFELRLGSEPELAREFEELAEADASLRAAFRDPVTPRASGRAPGRALGARRWAAAAAASVALFLGGRALLSQAPAPEVPYSLVLVETAPSDVGLHELLGLDPEWLPPGMGFRGGEGGTPPPADVYAEAVTAAFDEHAERAAIDGRSARGLRSFVVAVNPAGEAQALLVALGADGRIETLVPPFALLPAGERSWLPRDPVVLPDDWRTAQRVDYDPGVLTRSGVEVIVALREARGDERGTEAFDAAWEGWIEDLGRSPGAERGARLHDWLEARGFTVERIVVDR